MKYLLQLIFVFTFLSNGIYSGEIKFPKFPKKAKSVKSFIPRGWKVHSKAVGDLNGDSLPDVALVLKYKNENRKKNSYRILLILLKEGKKYKIFAKSKKAIMKLSEGGKTGDPFIGLNIER
ncbi:MAG: hypothetical protein KDK36_09800, partial [Leptospiraceae bacterium]|nr:hypothetical protein [Leptospiraceae bacterium]